MNRWFAALPIHRKLVVMAFAVSGAALGAALVGLVLIDVVRFRASEVDDARALADVIAENTAAAVMFGDSEAARETLTSVRVRPLVSTACVYRGDGGLLAQYARSDRTACPDRPSASVGWGRVEVLVPITRNGRVVGEVYLARELSDLGPRVVVTGVTGLGMLAVAAALAFGLAQRLQRAISRPIADLAAAVRRVGGEEPVRLDPIEAPPDEVGELVVAFEDMVQRVEQANAGLVASNRALREEVEERRRVEDALRREIDERRRIEIERERLLVREREASRLKDEFLAAVSHELRTPLNAILGWLQILNTMQPNEQTVERALASLSRNAQAQSRVIEDLLDVSRIVTGKLQLRLEEVDLRSVVDAAVEVIAPAARAKALTVDVAQHETPAIVNGDRDRLRQIVWNLLSNAVKFTPPGGRIDVAIDATPDGYTLAVQDTGSGIPASFLPHVFERFRQADGSMAREQGGLGLGLAIVKELAELHGGIAGASSEGAGKGARFWVRLPRLAPQDRGRHPEPRAGIERPPRLDGVRLLAIDDNPDALDILSTALTAVGAAVTVCDSGRAGLDRLAREPFDVVLCDLAMPQMDGFAVLERIRAIGREHGRSLPVIAVTAYATADHQSRALAAGFVRHVVKPFDTAALIRTIGEIAAQV